MKVVKKCIIIIVFVIGILFALKSLCIMLLNHGYVPFTEEYDHRIFMKHYKDNKEDFNLLVNEISKHLSVIPSEEYADGDIIRFDPQNEKWDVCIMKESKHLYEQTIAIENTKSIEQIENVYNEELMGIIYFKNENEYMFSIGEYYHVVISDDGVSVR